MAATLGKLCRLRVHAGVSVRRAVDDRFAEPGFTTAPAGAAVYPSAIVAAMTPTAQGAPSPPGTAPPALGPAQRAAPPAATAAAQAAPSRPGTTPQVNSAGFRARQCPFNRSVGPTALPFGPEMISRWTGAIYCKRMTATSRASPKSRPAPLRNASDQTVLIANCVGSESSVGGCHEPHRQRSA